MSIGVSMILVKPRDPGKYIDDLFTKGLEYAVRNNMKDFIETDSVVCGGEDEIDLMYTTERYTFEVKAIPTKYHIDLNTGFISDLLQSPRYNKK